MNEVILPPHAPTLLESLRAVGYSFESAIADIIDNSISAGAGSIRIEFRPVDNPYVAIIDDGHGMRPDELTQAMRHGSRHPGRERNASDLGRFGLGLKTASLSQCRRLTVVSVSDNQAYGARWDLDLIEKRVDWVLQFVSGTELQALPHADELLKQGRGTMILWEGFDRALAGETSPIRALADRMDAAREHLSLVFHRYISGEYGVNKLSLEINGVPVTAQDPFLVSARGTQQLPIDTLIVEGGTVRIEPYILPHVSRLSPAELKRAGGEEGLRRNQGFYVYRNKRLLTWGTWFRLTPLEELTKLARVQVDIPNTLDHLWTLDIKKSIAHPPEKVREGLRRTVERIAEASRRVYTFRSRRTTTDVVTHAWDRLAVRGGIRYAINREHPFIKAISDAIDDRERALLERLLQTLEVSFPADALYADMASERRVETKTEGQDTEEFLRDLAHRMLDAIGRGSPAAEQFLRSLPHIEPFSMHPNSARRIQESLSNAD